MTTDTNMLSITKVEVTKPTVKDLRAILDRHPDNSEVAFTTEYDGPSYEEVVTVTIVTEIERPTTGTEPKVNIKFTHAKTWGGTGTLTRNSADDDIEW